MSGGFEFDDDAVRRIAAAAESAVADGIEFLAEQANRTVPHQEGTLGRSARTSQDGARAALSYDTPYAVRQHEDTRLRHDEGRRAKWAERTFAEEARQVGDFVADRMRGAL